MCVSDDAVMLIVPRPSARLLAPLQVWEGGRRLRLIISSLELLSAISLRESSCVFAPHPPALARNCRYTHAGIRPAAERCLIATKATGRVKGPESGPSEVCTPSNDG